MKLEVLGCGGGVGQGQRTTSFLIDEHILLDAGSGVGELSITQLEAIDHVFLTHAHLDHTAFLPFLLDTVLGRRQAPVVVHALAETIAVLKAHIFNWQVWPDFNQIPSLEHPLLQYAPLVVGETVNVGNARITALPAQHSVPALGYLIEGEGGSIAFSGDTTYNDTFWHALNQVQNLQHLIVETAFSNADIELAKLSCHLCPSLLRQGLDLLQSRPQVWITHLKPGEADGIMNEIEQLQHPLAPQALQHGQTLTL